MIVIFIDSPKLSHHLLIEGRCVLGNKCLHPEQELRAAHKCPDCDHVLHALCGVFDKNRDKYICGCKNSSHLTEIDVTPNEQMAAVSTITHSTREDHYKEILRDFFITKN